MDNSGETAFVYHWKQTNKNLFRTSDYAPYRKKSFHLSLLAKEPIFEIYFVLESFSLLCFDRQKKKKHDIIRITKKTQECMTQKCVHDRKRRTKKRTVVTQTSMVKTEYVIPMPLMVYFAFLSSFSPPHSFFHSFFLRIHIHVPYSLSLRSCFF